MSITEVLIFILLISFTFNQLAICRHFSKCFQNRFFRCSNGLERFIYTHFFLLHVLLLLWCNGANVCCSHNRLSIGFIKTFFLFLTAIKFVVSFVWRRLFLSSSATTYRESTSLALDLLTSGSNAVNFRLISYLPICVLFFVFYSTVLYLTHTHTHTHTHIFLLWLSLVCLRLCLLLTILFFLCFRPCSIIRSFNLCSPHNRLAFLFVIEFFLLLVTSQTFCVCVHYRIHLNQSFP